MEVVEEKSKKVGNEWVCVCSVISTEWHPFERITKATAAHISNQRRTHKKSGGRTEQ